MTTTRTEPDRYDGWLEPATGPEGVTVVVEDARLWARREEAPFTAVVTIDGQRHVWTDEDIRRYWRRTARSRMRAAFAEDGYSDAVADRVALAMERAMRGYHGPGEPQTSPVPFYQLAWDGAQEGFWQAWRRPGMPEDEAERLAEDTAPSLAAQDAERQYAASARVERARREAADEAATRAPR